MVAHPQLISTLTPHPALPQRSSREPQRSNFDPIWLTRRKKKKIIQPPASHLVPRKSNKATAGSSQAQIKGEGPISICNYI